MSITFQPLLPYGLINAATESGDNTFTGTNTFTRPPLGMISLGGPIAFRNYAFVSANTSSATATSVSAGATTITYRVRKELLLTDEAITLTFANIISQVLGDASKTEASNTNSISIKCAIEINSVTYPVTFNGQRNWVIEGGYTVTSDPIFLPVAAKTAFFVRTAVTVANTNNLIPLNIAIRQSATVTYNRSGQSEGYAVGDAVDSGAITVLNGDAYGPTSINGVHVTSKSVAIIGDSITWGSTASLDQFGHHSRRSYQDSIPTINLGRGSETAQDFVQQIYSYRRMAIAAKCRAMFCCMGTNDLNAGRTAIQLATDINTIHNWFALSGRLSWQGTILPRMVGSVPLNFTTIGAQTQFSGEAQRVLFNDWVRGVQNSVYASVGAPAFGTRYKELCTTIEVNSSNVATLNGGYWACPAGVAAYTGTSNGASTAAANTLNEAILPGVFSWDTTTYQNTGMNGYVANAPGSTGANAWKQVNGNASSTAFTLAAPTNNTAPEVAWNVANGNTINFYLVTTADGTHPNDYGHQLIQANYNLTSMVI